jgi:hypothetical protein
MTMTDVIWMIEAPVTGVVREDDSTDTLVRGRDGQECWVTISPDGEMRFDGEFVDVGDLYSEYLAVLDDIAECGYSEPIDQVTREIMEREARVRADLGNACPACGRLSQAEDDLDRAERAIALLRKLATS